MSETGRAQPAIHREPIILEFAARATHLAHLVGGPRREHHQAVPLGFDIDIIARFVVRPEPVQAKLAAGKSPGLAIEIKHRAEQPILTVRPVTVKRRAIRADRDVGEAGFGSTDSPSDSSG